MEINLTQILLQAFNFGIILVVMTKFLYRPILKILEDRAKKVQEGLAAAQRSIEEREKIESEKQKEMAKAEKSAAKLLETARKEAESMKASILDEAKEEAKKAVEKQEKLLIEKMAEEEERLKSDIATLVVATTKSVLSGSLSDSELKKITESEVAQLSKKRKNG